MCYDELQEKRQQEEEKRRQELALRQATQSEVRPEKQSQLKGPKSKKVQPESVPA